MKAYLRSARIAPKKANLVAKMVRGMTVDEAMAALRRTHKKAARLIEKLLASAVANATHNDKQDASQLEIRSIVVNQGTAYHRGVPMARGRIRPMRKFLSHIDLVLGVRTEDVPEKKKAGKSAKAGKTVGTSSAPRKARVQQSAKNTTAKGKNISSASTSSASVSS